MQRGCEIGPLRGAAWRSACESRRENLRKTEEVSPLRLEVLDVPAQSSVGVSFAKIRLRQGGPEGASMPGEAPVAGCRRWVVSLCEVLKLIHSWVEHRDFCGAARAVSEVGWPGTKPRQMALTTGRHPLLQS